MEDAADLDGLLARLAEDRRDDPEDHPGSERLSAYQAGELSPEEDDEIQEHLANCRLCAGRLQDLQRFLDPPPEDRPREGVADFETEVEWRRLREKLGTKPSKARQFFGSLKTAYGLAAMLAVTVVVLSVQLGQRNSGQEVVSLSSNSSTRGVNSGVEESSEWEIPSEATSIFFVLGTSDSESYSNYRLELSDPQNRIRRFSGVRKVGDHFNFELPRRRLVSGIYNMQVFGLKNGSEELVDEYRVRLLFPEEAEDAT